MFADCVIDIEEIWPYFSSDTQIFFEDHKLKNYAMSET